MSLNQVRLGRVSMASAVADALPRLPRAGAGGCACEPIVSGSRLSGLGPVPALRDGWTLCTLGDLNLD